MSKMVETANPIQVNDRKDTSGLSKLEQSVFREFKYHREGMRKARREQKEAEATALKTRKYLCKNCGGAMSDPVRANFVENGFARKLIQSYHTMIGSFNRKNRKNVVNIKKLATYVEKETMKLLL